jgi:hypothetical protein
MECQAVSKEKCASSPARAAAWAARLPCRSLEMARRSSVATRPSSPRSRSGDDADAKAEVISLFEDAGFFTEDLP